MDPLEGVAEGVVGTVGGFSGCSETGGSKSTTANFSGVRGGVGESDALKQLVEIVKMVRNAAARQYLIEPARRRRTTYD